MSEFVNGYESMARIGPCVSIFGSARTKPDTKYYLLAEKIAYKISKAGYGVITGGGPGIMEAGNKGAHNGGGTSVGSLNYSPDHSIGPCASTVFQSSLAFCFTLNLFGISPKRL